MTLNAPPQETSSTSQHWNGTVHDQNQSSESNVKRVGPDEKGTKGIRTRAIEAMETALPKVSRGNKELPPIPPRLSDARSSISPYPETPTFNRTNFDVESEEHFANLIHRRFHDSCPRPIDKDLNEIYIRVEKQSIKLSYEILFATLSVLNLLNRRLIRRTEKYSPAKMTWKSRRSSTTMI